MKKDNEVRNMFIFKTDDEHFVYLKNEIVEDILQKEEFSFFCKLDKEEQLSFLKHKKMTLSEIKSKTTKIFRHSFIN